MNALTEICVGSQYLMDGKTYEVINLTQELISLRDINGKREQYFRPDDFQGLLFQKEIALFQRAPLQESNATFFLHSSDPHVIEAQRKYYYVERLKIIFGGSLPKKHTLEEIDKLSKKYGDKSPPCYTSVWAWTRLCRTHSWSPFVLLKKSSSLPRGKVTPETTMQIVDRYINEEYLSSQKNTVNYVYRLIKGQIIHDNLLRSENNANLIKTPSLSTFRRRIKKLCGILTDTRRIGFRLAHKKNKVNGKCERPDRLLEKVEMDCNYIDLQLVDETGKNLGRLAYLQAMIDVKSKKIIAYDLSFTPPCAEKTLRVLKMALTAVPGEELQRGKMQELIVDNGIEVTNTSFKLAAQVLGIQIRYVPPKSPDSKPHIERFFRTMNCQFVHTLPGTTFSNPTDRGDYDSEGKAIYTIEKFQERFNEWLEGFYHNNPQGSDKCSPNQRWDASIANQLPPEKFFAKDLDRLLRLIERRTISGGCVTFFELSWSGPGLAEMEQRLKKNEKAYIYYDPSNLLEVFVSLPDRPDDLFRAKGTRPEYQANLTLFEHNLVLNELKKNNTDFTTKLADYTLWQNRQKIAFDIENFMSCKTKNKSRQRNKNITNDRTVDHSSLMRSKTSSHQAEAECKEFDTFYVSDANYEQHKRNP